MTAQCHFEAHDWTHQCHSQEFHSNFMQVKCFWKLPMGSWQGQLASSLITWKLTGVKPRTVSKERHIHALPVQALVTQQYCIRLKLKKTLHYHESWKPMLLLHSCFSVLPSSSGFNLLYCKRLPYEEIVRNVC